MDKTKLRKKKKRRHEKRLVIEAEERQLAEQYKSTFKANGLRSDFSKSAILKAHKQIQADFSKRAIVLYSLAVLYAMHKLHRFGKLRLYRLAVDITIRVSDIGSRERSVEQFAEELNDIAGFDVTPYRKELESIAGKYGKNKKDTESSLMFRRMSYLLPIQIYAVYASLGYKRKRLTRLCDAVNVVVQNMVINNKAEDYMADLEKIGLKCNLDGQYGILSKYATKETDRLNRVLERSGRRCS